MHLPIYFGKCMTCTWMIVMMGANASFTIAGNIVLVQLIARSIKGNARGTIMGTFHLFGSLGSLSFSLIGGALI